MSVADKKSSRDEALEHAFGAPLADLYAQVVRSGASPALTRALEVRAMLALSEEQVVRVRDRVHATMAPAGSLDELSAETLQTDVYWLDAALSGRRAYLKTLDALLAAMPPATARSTTLTSSFPPAQSAPSAPVRPAARGR
ncbi:hypothetical protein ACFCWY_15365 [Streptomyces sp. NPDC056362]|uniref:hypothetical protein n=1 Tax=unclassified Streptomyces TaxID=2593676 RepID=UPI0035DF5D7A